MKAELKHILIEVKDVKPNYIIRIDGLFGTIVNVDKQNAKATVNFTDGSSTDYTIDELKYCVVKFLAVMKDLNTFPVTHGDFSGIINYFDTKEKVKDFVNGVREVLIEGTLVNVATYPKEGDVIEITSLKIAEKHGFLNDRINRIGTVDIKNSTHKDRFLVKFPSKSITLKRSEFDILNGLNAKQVFKLNV